MSEIDVAALRAAAEAATPGPWEWDGTWGVDRRESPTSVTGVVYEADVDDAAYIAAANPAVVLALLDEVERLRSYVTAVRTLPRWLEENGLDDQTVNFVAVNIEGMTNS